MNMSRAVLILLDSDVFIHLFKADILSLLNKLYPKRIRMLDVVKDELEKNGVVKNHVEMFFKLKEAEPIVFPIDLLSELKSYKVPSIGLGEKACLIYCKHNSHIIASSNTKDIVPYCKDNLIAYLTTLDLFAVAIKRGIITEKEANQMIKKITANNGSYLCCDKIENHIKYHFDIEKYLY